MERLFDLHLRTPVQDLNGPWAFQTDPEDRGREEGWYHSLPDAKSVIVPSVWNTEFGLLEYEGIA